MYDIGTFLVNLKLFLSYFIIIVIKLIFSCSREGIFLKKNLNRDQINKKTTKKNASCCPFKKYINCPLKYTRKVHVFIHRAISSYTIPFHLSPHSHELFSGNLSLCIAWSRESSWHR